MREGPHIKLVGRLRTVVVYYHAGAVVAVDGGAAGVVAAVHVAAVGCEGSPLGNGFEVGSSQKGLSAAPAAPTRVSSGHWSFLPACARCTGRTLCLSTATEKLAITNIGGKGNDPIDAPTRNPPNRPRN